MSTVALQIWFGPIPEKNQRCMDTVKEIYGDDYLLINPPAVDLPILASDYLKFDLGAEFPNLVYVDCDVELHKRLDLNADGIACFGYYMGQPNSGIFAVNGNPEIFSFCLEEKARRGIPDIYEWTQKVLRDKPVKQIPDEYFTHHTYTLKEIAE